MMIPASPWIVMDGNVVISASVWIVMDTMMGRVIAPVIVSFLRSIDLIQVAIMMTGVTMVATSPWIVMVGNMMIPTSPWIVMDSNMMISASVWIVMDSMVR